VDQEQYIVMRHIFVRQLGLENDFDFLEFVTESMENEFASLVGVRKPSCIAALPHFRRESVHLSCFRFVFRQSGVS
jgi:hypothetical protein